MNLATFTLFSMSLFVGEPNKMASGQVYYSSFKMLGRGVFRLISYDD